jgi:TetR/AcrR family transcriptional repressor of nem operon
VIPAGSRYRGGPPGADWDLASLALFPQTVLQGAFVVAKARNDKRVVIDAIDHLKRYVRSLFKPRKTKAPRHEP